MLHWTERYIASMTLVPKILPRIAKAYDIMKQCGKMTRFHTLSTFRSYHHNAEVHLSSIKLTKATLSEKLSEVYSTSLICPIRLRLNPMSTIILSQDIGELYFVSVLSRSTPYPTTSPKQTLP